MIHRTARQRQTGTSLRFAGAFDYADILARRFAANGTPLSPSFKVVSPAAYFQNYPHVAVRGNGDVLIGWVAADPYTDEPYKVRLLARRFDAGNHHGSKILLSRFAPAP